MANRKYHISNLVSRGVVAETCDTDEPIRVTIRGSGTLVVSVFRNNSDHPIREVLRPDMPSALEFLHDIMRRY